MSDGAIKTCKRGHTDIPGSRTNGGHCRQCKREYDKKWSAENPEKCKSYSAKHQAKPETKLYQKRWAESHPESIRASQKKYVRTPEYRKRRVSLQRKYATGWEPEAYDIAVLRQEGKCAICADPCTRLHADHDHATKTPRQLLCQHCNHGLGNFKDSPELMNKAIAYLIRHSKAGVPSR